LPKLLRLLVITPHSPPSPACPQDLEGRAPGVSVGGTARPFFQVRGGSLALDLQVEGEHQREHFALSPAR